MSTFSGILAVPADFGQVFVISGKATRTAKRFDVNLAADKSNMEIPFHISFRFTENDIVRNNRTNQGFGLEEKQVGLKNVRNPFFAGGDFLISIFVGTDRFHLATNDSHYCDFHFRAPVQRVTVLQIQGDVEVIKQVDHRLVFPYLHPIAQPRKLTDNFSNDIPLVPRAGLVMVVKGMPIGNAQGGFTLRIFVGNSAQQALHFDVRFAQNVVARNHTCNEKREFDMKDEERHGGFPFTFNRIFKIAIGLGTTGFRVAVNGAYFCDFTYRAKLEKFGGIRMTENNGLILNILELDHFWLDSSLKGLENLSKN
ncbi:galectin-8-like [Bradysia coprophila]|uniref:galectin-8-like n=1 Tax=Bradysia coprophila TaxID=38358 RepID=UPI00187DB93F|nr:galectin-8-like [Bradysia coprophila]